MHRESETTSSSPKANSKKGGRAVGSTSKYVNEIGSACQLVLLKSFLGDLDLTKITFLFSNSISKTQYPLPKP
jgi:hypothetical protein